MLLAIIITLTAAGLLAMLASATPRASTEGYPGVVGSATIAVLVATLLLAILGWKETGSLYGVIHAGPVSMLGVIILTAIGALVSAGVLANPAKYRSGPGEFFGFVIFTVLGGILMVASSNLLVLYLGIELSSYSTYILVGYYRDESFSNEAAAKYFLLGAVASAILLFGISLVYFGTSIPTVQGLAPGTLSFAPVPCPTAQTGEPLSMSCLLGYAAANGIPTNPLLWPGLAFILVGFGFKLAAVPFHSWTPDAYQGAPSMVAALLSVGPKAAAVIALTNLLNGAFNAAEFANVWRPAIMWLAILSMTVGNLQAIGQRNVKRLLGYSSIAQLGYVLVGVATATTAGTTALILYVAGYAFTNIGAFTVIAALRDAGVGEEMDDLAGLVRRSPLAAILLAGFFMSLAGVPLLAGFLGKLLVFKSAVDANLVPLVIVAVVNTVFAYYYYFRVLVQVFLAEPRDPRPVTLNPTAVTALAVALTGVVILGVFPTPLLNVIQQAAQTIPIVALR